MINFDVFESIGDFPIRKVKIKQKNKKNYLLASVSVATLLIVGLFGVNKVLNSNFYTGEIPPAFGPIAVFGLSPINSDSVELISEDIVFKKDTSRTGNLEGLYNVEMNYKVNLNETTKFILPFTHMKDNSAAQIYVDGVLVDDSVTTHPTSYVKRPMINNGSNQQSVNFVPPNNELEYQPDNSYEILMNTWENTSYNLSMDTKFNVYDVSGAKAQIDQKNASFEVEGNLEQLGLLFVDGECEMSRYEMNYIDEKKRIGASEFYLSSSAAKKKWLAVLSDEDDLTVKIGNNVIENRIMTLNEILSESLSISENSKSDYIKKLSLYLSNAKPDGNVFVVGNESSLDKSISNQGKGLVDMCEFEIVEPGEHQMTIKSIATGESDLSNYYMIEWMGSSKNMWSKIPERRLRIDVNGNLYDYLMTDNLFKFELEK